MTRFLLLSRSATVDAALLAQMAGAIEIQLNRDFAPAWAPAARFLVSTDPQDEARFSLGSDPYCVLTFVDTALAPGDAGYHAAIGASPYAAIQVPDCVGVALSEVASHEVLETAADWEANLVVPPAPVGGFGAFAAAASTGPSGEDLDLEVCDPVQGQRYQIGGVTASNFVLPNYFLGGTRPYDFLGELQAPGKPCPTGYQLLRDGNTLLGERASAPSLEWRRGWRRQHGTKVT